MKRAFLFSTLFLFLIVVSSCSHDWVAPVTKASVGEWQWVYSNGGVGNDTIAPINSTLITLSLNDDSTYTFYLNNEQQANGHYTIQTTANTRVIHFDQHVQINMLSMQPEQQIIKWDDSRLHFLDENISDGYHHYFERVK